MDTNIKQVLDTLNSGPCSVEVHHIREKNKKGEVSPFGGRTVIRLRSFYNHEEDIHVEGVALCSKHDVFCKDVGIRVAFRRLMRAWRRESTHWMEGCTARSREYRLGLLGR